MVANGGLLFIIYSFLPGEFLITLFGSARVNAPSWTLVAYERVLMFDMREILMPGVMNNFKLAEPLRLKQRPFLLAMGIALVLAMGVSYYSSLDLAYTHGAVNLQHWTYMISTTVPFNRLTSILQHPTGIEVERLGSFIFGGATMFGMLWMRHHYLWWKLHPIGSSTDDELRNLLFLGFILHRLVSQIHRPQVRRRCPLPQTPSFRVRHCVRRVLHRRHLDRCRTHDRHRLSSIARLIRVPTTLPLRKCIHTPFNPHNLTSVHKPPEFMFYRFGMSLNTRNQFRCFFLTIRK